MAEWVKPLIQIMMSGVAETVDYQIRQIFDAIEKPYQYLRVDSPLPEDVNHDMDDATQKNMNALRNQGKNVAERFDKELEIFARKLVSSQDAEYIV
jgi:hypothetical protein